MSAAGGIVILVIVGIPALAFIALCAWVAPRDE